ncbi:hypothetical protein imdm_1301 [gamma proteobacterium IMCC2047]|nr:hypothetical protein imdm_1301 [gamma proteobacterium IMCC2047]
MITETYRKLKVLYTATLNIIIRIRDMTNRLYGLILTASISFASTSCYAEIYRWIDEQGNVHFGDKPHADKQATDITGNVQLKNIDQSADRTQQSLQQFDLRQQVQSVETQQRQAQQQKKGQKLNQACHDAKQRLKILQGRVIFVDKNGNEIKRTEQERQQRADALRKNIKKYCR